MFICVGSAFAIGASSYSFGRADEPGPAYFPFGLGVLLAAVGVLLGATAVLSRQPDPDRVGRFAWRPLLAILGSVFLFAVTLPRLGLFMAMPILVVVASLASAGFRWRDVLLTCVALTAGCWVVFDWGLNLNIPIVPSFFHLG